jgi:hypothetical protein
MTIPSFLLAKLYVRGSLKNTDEGFEFSLKNIVDETMLSGVGPIGAGGKSYGAESLSLVVKDKAWEGAELALSDPAPVPIGVPIKVVVRGEKLGGGSQRVSVQAMTADGSALKFDISDKIGG